MTTPAHDPQHVARYMDLATFMRVPLQRDPAGLAPSPRSGRSA